MEVTTPRAVARSEATATQPEVDNGATADQLHSDQLRPDRHCLLEGTKHPRLGSVPLLLIGPNEMATLMAHMTAPLDDVTLSPQALVARASRSSSDGAQADGAAVAWLCAPCYAELRLDQDQAHLEDVVEGSPWL